MDTITIRFRSSVSESMRLGVGCPVPPDVTLSVDPSTLTQQDRELLASRLNDAGDVCRCDEEGYCSTHRHRYRARSCQRDDSQPCKVVTAATPRLEDLLDAIRAEEHAIATYEERRAAQAAAKAQEDRQHKLAQINGEPARQTRSLVVALHASGEIDTCDSSYHSPVIAQSRVEYLRDYIYYYGDAGLTEAEATEYRDRAKRLDAETEARKQAAFDAAAAALRAEHWQPRLDWIAAHGSARLKRLAAEGINHVKTYETERTAYDTAQFEAALTEQRPGWRAVSQVDRDVRDLSLRSLALLDAARVVEPTAKLARYDGKIVAVAEFHGKLIIWPRD